MKSKIVLILAMGLTGGLLFAQYNSGSQDKPPAAKPDFDITASYIEACSCDMFCPCYFNTRSTHHHEGEFCRANLVLRTDNGYYKDTKLDGAKVWLATDLGSGFLWNVDMKTGEAHAKMDNGKGEVILERMQGNDAAHEIIVHNLKYWLATSNNGFRMWKNKHEAFEGHGHKFSYDGTNGFLITIHFSGQAKTAAAD